MKNHERDNNAINMKDLYGNNKIMEELFYWCSSGVEHHNPNPHLLRKDMDEN
jgi:hypothetical protein